jgi:DNA-binding NtrC family response regulator
MPTLILVEDCEDVRGFLESALGAHFEVRAFASVAAAIDALGEATPQFVLSDLDVEHANGEELARAAVRLAIRPRVILMSGDWQRLERAAAQADAILRKPFSLLELWTAVAPISSPAGAD